MQTFLYNLFLSAPLTVHYKLQAMKMYAKIDTLWFKWDIFQNLNSFIFIWHDKHNTIGTTIIEHITVCNRSYHTWFVIMILSHRWHT